MKTATKRLVPKWNVPDRGVTWNENICTVDEGLNICAAEVCMDWILDFLTRTPDCGCVRQDPDSGFLNKNGTRTGFGFCNLLMKNGLWEWAVPVIAKYVLPTITVTIVLQVFRSVPRYDRKVPYAVAMHEWFTHRLFSWLHDMAV